MILRTTLHQLLTFFHFQCLIDMEVGMSVGLQFFRICRIGRGLYANVEHYLDVSLNATALPYHQNDRYQKGLALEIIHLIFCDV